MSSDCIIFSLFSILQVDVDIGSSTVATGVLGLVFGTVASLVVDIAFLIQVGSIYIYIYINIYGKLKR